MNINKAGFIFIAGLCFAILGVCGSAWAITGPVLSLSTTTLSFGNHLVTTESGTQKVTVINTGGSTLTIISITLGGANPAQFTKTDTCGATLASGATCTIKVKFEPTSTGAKSATLNVDVASPALSGSVALSGTGTGPALTVAPPTVTFADRLISTVSGTRTISVSNPGTTKLTINSITLTGANPGQFSKTSTCGGGLASGATCTISVIFKPTSAGGKSASLTVNVASPAVSKTVALTGTCTAPVLAVSPTALEFNNLLVSTISASQPVAVNNFGSAPLTISGIVLGGVNLAQFSKTDTCGATLASGATCTVFVKFKPTSVGEKSATIRINVAAPAVSQTVTLAGRGVKAVAVPSAPTGVTALAGLKVVGLTWDEVDDATSYNIYWSKSPNVTTGNGTKIPNIKKNSYTHKNRTPGITYYYIVTAVNALGEGDPSSEASSHVPRLKKTTLSNTVGMVVQYITYTYNADGRMEKVSTYGATGVISNYVVYEYDAEGRPTKLSTYNFADLLTGYTTIEYNAEGKVYKTSVYGPVGNLMQYTTFLYTAAGKPSQVTVYGATGIVSTYTTYQYTYEYHDAGDVTRINIYNFADLLIAYSTTEYDTSGTKVRVTSYGPTGLLSEQTTYEYDDVGNEVRVSNYNLTGLTDYTTTEYDADGNETMEKEYDFADILTAYATMGYNAAGLPLNESSYGPTGLLKGRTTMEYE